MNPHLADIIDSCKDIVVCQPSFYVAGSLFRVGKEEPKAQFYVATGEDIFHLNGSAVPIHDANKSAGLQIDRDNAAEYLKFFCTFLVTSGGRFNIVSEPRLVADFDSRFQFEALVRYSGQMFNAVFSVPRNGIVAMIDDEPLGMVQ